MNTPVLVPVPRPQQKYAGFMHEENLRQASPVSTFDPSEDGWAPMPLNDVVEAGRTALAALDAFRFALHGCTTPLNLNPTNDKLLSMVSELEDQIRTMEKAREVIETDTLLATGYQGKPLWAVETDGVLSPRQILSMARRAQEVGPSEQTTYRAAVTELDPVPTLLAKDRSMGFKAQGSTDWDEIYAGRNEHRYRLVQEILAGIESIECSSCQAPAGSPCMTASGGIADESHMPRQRAYKMRPDQAWASTHVNRRADNAAIHPELRGKSWQEVKAILDSRR